MFPTEGRTEKRIRLSVPLELSKLQYPNDAERAVTENISPIGARVVSRRPMEPDERLMVRFLELSLQTQARVVYCQRLRHGQFGLGLQFQGMSIPRGTRSLSAGHTSLPDRQEAGYNSANVSTGLVHSDPTIRPETIVHRCLDHNWPYVTGGYTSPGVQGVKALAQFGGSSREG